MLLYLILLSLLPGKFEKTDTGFSITPTIVLVGQWFLTLTKSFFASVKTVKAEATPAKAKPKRKKEVTHEEAN